MTKGSRRSNSRQPDYEDELAGTSQSGNGGMMLHLTEGLIPKFTSQEKTYPATRWVQDVEDNAELCGWTPLQQLLMARRSLAGTALLWFRAERVFKTWEEFKAGILKEFPDNIDAKAIHEMMSARHKKHDESCLEYMFVMKELGKRGKISDYVAIKYIVEGIKDQEVNKIMLYGVTAYSELKEKLKIYEQLKANIASTSREASRPRHPEKTYGRAVTRCYSCGEENHASADCPHKERGLKCFKCNQFGHIASQCESTGTVTAATSRFNKNDVSLAANGDGGNNVRRWSSDVDAGGAGIAAKCNFYGSSDNTTQDDAIGGSSKMAHHCLTTMTTVRTDTEINNNERSISTNKPIKQVTVFKSNVLALVDSASDVNLLAYECFKQLNAPELDKSEISLFGLGAYKVECYGRIELNIIIDEQWYNDVLFYVIPTEAMPYSMILGQDLLQSCILVMENNNVKLKPAGSEVGPDTERKVKDLVESCIPRKTKVAPVKLRIVPKDDIPVAQRPRSLAQAEQTEVNQQVTQWCQPVSQVQKCINSTHQRSINTSPFELLVGTKMKVKEDNEIYALLEQENRDSYVLTREENRRSAKEQILKVQEENRRIYNKKRKESTKYQEGDLVAIKRTQFGVGMKLKPKYLGPYQVVEATRRNRYRVQKVDDSPEGSKMPT